MELSSGLTFPATEYLSHIIHTRALQGNEMLDSLCGHISVFPVVYLLIFSQCLHHGLWCWTALTSASSITQWSVSSGTCWGSSSSEKCIWYLPDCRYTLQSLKTFNPYWMSSYSSSFAFPCLCLPPFVSPLFWRFSWQLIWRVSGTITAWTRRCRWSRGTFLMTNTKTIQLQPGEERCL